MVHLNDWRRPQARFPPHRHNLMLTSPTSLRIAAAKAIVVKRYLPTSSLCSTILNKSNFTVLADRVQINRKQDWIRSDLQTKNELNLINLHNTYRESIVSLVSQHYSKLKYAPEKLLLLIQFIYVLWSPYLIISVISQNYLRIAQKWNIKYLELRELQSCSQLIIHMTELTPRRWFSIRKLSKLQKVPKNRTYWKEITGPKYLFLVFRFENWMPNWAKFIANFKICDFKTFNAIICNKLSLLSHIFMYILLKGFSEQDS